MWGKRRNKTKKFWDEILEGPAVISEEEAKAIGETVKKIRKEYGFRDKHRISLKD